MLMMSSVNRIRGLENRQTFETDKVGHSPSGIPIRSTVFRLMRSLARTLNCLSRMALR